MSYLVSQRVKEIGIRVALGADPREVSWLVVRQGLRPVVIGAGLGMLGAAALSAALHAQLQSPGTPDMFYGVSAFDPPTYIGLASFLALVALGAAWVPATRAARIDPTTALRGD
jgi:ABC-type lipoprotein release transport system permease subunit